MTYTLQAPCSNDPVVHAALALESFSDLDQARDVALSLVQEFGLDIDIIQHFGAASCVWEEYDAASYGG
jgi:hypothetical protein